MHFALSAPYVRIVPAWVPYPLLAVYVSGVAEVAGGAGLVVPSVRRAAAWGLIALLVCVFPANVHMLQLARDAGESGLYVAALWARLPLQAVLIWWIWRANLRQRPFH